jgi:glutamyl-tRNA reductase
MPIVCLGLSYRTAPVEIRERVAFAADKLGAVAHEISQLRGLGEAVVVSTCNRMEIYAGLEPGSTQDPVAAVAAVEMWLRQHFQIAGEIPAETFFHHTKEAAVRHLFGVASGLDSMVLGETEIFGQVKAAYHAAHERGATARTLNKLFQEAFRVGKMVRNHTEIQRGATSVGSVAVELAEQLFGKLDTCRVLLLGAGEISRRTAQSLQSRGAQSILVSNRSPERALEMAAEMGGRAIPFEHWQQEISAVDILISSTSAPHTVVHPADLEQALRKRRGGRPLFLIDIAVPRDIDPAVAELENVYLFDIDALEQIAQTGRERRQRELERCHSIIETQVRDSAIFRPQHRGPTAPIIQPIPDPK